MLLLAAHTAAFNAPCVLARSQTSRVTRYVMCAANDDKSLDTADLEAKLKEAVEREDYKAAAALKVQLNQAIEAAPVPVKSMYESLQKRSQTLASRRDAIVRERKLVKELGGGWPQHEIAQKALWQHWFGEYGERARERLVAADGDAAALLEIMEEFPDWVEPPNRLATLLYMEGEFEGSVDLCLKILRQKPWHFGASSGIVMCYAKLGDAKKANEWAVEAMPRPGPEREQWVERMVETLDAKLAELEEIAEL